MFERVEDLQSGPLKITLIARDNRQSVAARGRGNETVFHGQPPARLFKQKLLVGPHVRRHDVE